MLSYSNITSVELLEFRAHIIATDIQNKSYPSLAAGYKIQSMRLKDREFGRFEELDLGNIPSGSLINKHTVILS